MSKSANPGELRTKARFVTVEHVTDPEGYPMDAERNVFGEGKSVMVKWINAHGTDAFTAMQLELSEPATVTMRYSELVTPQCMVFKGDDPVPYEIISIDNVEERGRWLEIKVQRRERAR